ncbi:MAG: helix-turn-helix transcriptional regulator [Ruminococcaceae bacterium]|nr:helix-turn-helix transcriptional regulator [Oscillospiraceae bacterium]
MEKSTIAAALQHLMERDKVNTKELAKATGIPPTTLYSMLGKKTSQADLLTLKQLADYFGENVSIFCGLAAYERPIRLSDKERLLLTSYRGFSEEGKNRLFEYLEDMSVNPKYLAGKKKTD